MAGADFSDVGVSAGGVASGACDAVGADTTTGFVGWVRVGMSVTSVAGCGVSPQPVSAIIQISEINKGRFIFMVIGTFKS
jgi:hypothetical protein